MSAKLPDNGCRRGEAQQSSQIPEKVSRHVHGPAGIAVAELRNFLARRATPRGLLPAGPGGDIAGAVGTKGCAAPVGVQDAAGQGPASDILSPHAR
jgi:hypothetical protein